MSKITPNWQHHSRKDQKRSLRPVALRNAKRRLKALKKKLLACPQNIAVQ